MRELFTRGGRMGGRRTRTRTLLNRHQNTLCDLRLRRPGNWTWYIHFEKMNVSLGEKWFIWSYLSFHFSYWQQSIFMSFYGFAICIVWKQIKNENLNELFNAQHTINIFVLLELKCISFKKSFSIEFMFIARLGANMHSISPNSNHFQIKFVYRIEEKRSQNRNRIP